MDYRCYSCLAKAFVKLVEKHNLSEDSREDLVKEFFQFMAATPKEFSAPEVARINQHKMCEILKDKDPYKEIKYLSNKYLLDKYDELRAIVDNSDDKFETALRLAISGNIIDYAANADFDLDGTIKKVLEEEFSIDDSKVLKEKLSKANNVLYLGDNAGEIVMDKIFLETLNHPNVCYVVRGAAVINDVTLEDVKQTGIDKYAEIITNGYDAPSTILNKVSEEFMEKYRAADVIISKGQGNYEGLLNVKDDRIFFLMMVKCDMVAEKIGSTRGGFVVCRNK
jgi:uncharacterized protein with ATP-grasp and redox domains